MATPKLEDDEEKINFVVSYWFRMIMKKNNVSIEDLMKVIFEFYERIDSPQPIEMNYKIISIQCGANFNVCLADDHNLVVFGDNMLGQLGKGTISRIVVNEDCYPCVIPYFHQLRRNPFDEIKIKKISCGYGFTAVIDNRGLCYLWGANLSHQVSYQNEHAIKDVNILQNENNYWQSDINKIIDVSCGAEHIVYLTEDNKIFISGKNFAGVRPSFSMNKDVYI